MNERLKKILGAAMRFKNRGAYEEALEILTAAEGEFPKDAALLGITGDVYYMLGRVKESARYFKKVVKLSPHSELASLGLFHSSWQLGREEEAIAELVRFQSVSHCPDYDEIAEALREEGRLP